MSDLARNARGRTVKPLVILLQKRVVNARMMVKAFRMSNGNELYEIVIAHQVLRVKAKVESPLILVARLVVARRGDISLTAENRLYMHPRKIAINLLFLRTALIIKVLEGKKVAVVRHRQGGHPKFTRLLDERHNLALSVQ